MLVPLGEERLAIGSECLDDCRVIFLGRLIHQLLEKGGLIPGFEHLEQLWNALQRPPFGHAFAPDLARAHDAPAPILLDELSLRELRRLASHQHVPGPRCELAVVVAGCGMLRHRRPRAELRTGPFSRTAFGWRQHSGIAKPYYRRTRRRRTHDGSLRFSRPLGQQHAALNHPSRPRNRQRRPPNDAPRPLVRGEHGALTSGRLPRPGATPSWSGVAPETSRDARLVLPVADRRLSRRHARDGHAEGRARDVSETNLLEELDR